MPVSPLSSPPDVSGCNHRATTGLEWISFSVALSLSSSHHRARGATGGRTPSQPPNDPFRSLHKIYEINRINPISTLPSKLFQYLSTEPKKSCNFVQFLLHWINSGKPSRTFSNPWSKQKSLLNSVHCRVINKSTLL